MQKHVIDFYPPILAIDGEFNTFRLGLFYSKRLNVGDQVYLMNGKEKLIIGVAEVIDLSLGILHDMLQQHANNNHAVLHMTTGHSEALADILRRFYGPQIATMTRKTTVVHLRRLDGARGLQQVSTDSA